MSMPEAFEVETFFLDDLGKILLLLLLALLTALAALATVQKTTSYRDQSRILWSRQRYDPPCGIVEGNLKISDNLKDDRVNKYEPDSISSTRQFWSCAGILALKQLFASKSFCSALLNFQTPVLKLHLL